MGSDFYERFGIKIDANEARRRFVNRVYNEIYSGFLDAHLMSPNGQGKIYSATKEVANELGEIDDLNSDITSLVGDNFDRNLQALEVLYKNRYIGGQAIEPFILKVLDDSEPGLGIRWENGKFVPAGAKMLDEKLVNDELRWLRDQKYESVLKPFSKGLEHFLHSKKRPELLSDVVTDMHEALEATAKIVTGRPDKDLSANKELFISKVSASNEYKKLLGDYIEYANKFRHAGKEGQKKPSISPKEAESFIYLTGLFIRLAIDT